MRSPFLLEVLTLGTRISTLVSQLNTKTCLSISVTNISLIMDIGRRQQGELAHTVGRALPNGTGSTSTLLLFENSYR